MSYTGILEMMNQPSPEKKVIYPELAIARVSHHHLCGRVSKVGKFEWKYKEAMCVPLVENC